MLRAGASVLEMCERLGIHHRSWYRYVHASDPASIRPKTIRRRRANAISREVERRIMQLDAEGLTRVTIAERVGLHINTVVKYLLRAGRRKT
jgi:transposase